MESPRQMADELEVAGKDLLLTNEDHQRAMKTKLANELDSLRGSSVKIGTIQRRLAWPLRKDDTHTNRSTRMSW